MNSSNLLFALTERFFSDYLCSQRNASRHTISAYGDTFRLLLLFLARRNRTTIDRLAFQTICPEAILDFLGHIERERGSSIRTRNARLAAIRSFARFCLPHLAAGDVASLQRILAIPLKRAAKPVLGYMSRPEVAAVLASIDTSNPTGLRDHLLFSLLYQTGARISEALQLTVSGIQGSFIRFQGKGRKERAVPICPELRRQLQHYMRVMNLQPDQPLFANRQGQPLSREGAAQRLELALHIASKSCQSLAGRRITPHTWRHSTAMHLLQAGVPLEIIALWLGHEQPVVTLSYVQADLDMKRECMQLLEHPNPQRHPRHSARFSRLLSFLKAL